MASTVDAGSPATRTEGALAEPSSQWSDIRSLAGKGGDEEAFELTQPRPHVLRPQALDPVQNYVEARGGPVAGSVVLKALELGDLPLAITSLIHENHELRQDLEASRSDFEELRAVNLSIQERMDEAIGVADDQRLQLLEDAERLRDELLSLETQLDQMRRGYESDLEQSRRLIEGLEFENTELRGKLLEFEPRT